MDTGKDLGEVLMGLREATAPGREMTDDQTKVQDFVFDGMTDQEQAMFRDFGSALLDIIKDFKAQGLT